MDHSNETINDQAPVPMRVIVAASTGVLRTEVAAALDSDFEVFPAADAPAAEAAAGLGAHCLVVIADDLVNCTAEALVQRVRLAAGEESRLSVCWLAAHADQLDLLAASQAGADDVGYWPIEADMFRARLRSLVRVAVLEASMGRAAASGELCLGDLREALSTSTHLINNAVAGISGRAQLAALTRSHDDAGLVPVCLAEARKVSLVLGALHRLSEALGERFGNGEAMVPACEGVTRTD